MRPSAYQSVIPDAPLTTTKNLAVARQTTKAAGRRGRPQNERRALLDLRAGADLAIAQHAQRTGGRGRVAFAEIEPALKIFDLVDGQGSRPRNIVEVGGRAAVVGRLRRAPLAHRRDVALVRARSAEQTADVGLRLVALQRRHFALLRAEQLGRAGQHDRGRIDHALVAVDLERIERRLPVPAHVRKLGRDRPDLRLAVKLREPARGVDRDHVAPSGRRVRGQHLVDRILEAVAQLDPGLLCSGRNCATG